MHIHINTARAWSASGHSVARKSKEQERERKRRAEGEHIERSKAQEEVPLNAVKLEISSRAGHMAGPPSAHRITTTI